MWNSPGLLIHSFFFYLRCILHSISVRENRNREKRLRRRLKRRKKRRLRKRQWPKKLRWRQEIHWSTIWRRRRRNRRRRMCGCSWPSLISALRLFIRRSQNWSDLIVHLWLSCAVAILIAWTTILSGLAVLTRPTVLNVVRTSIHRPTSLAARVIRLTLSPSPFGRGLRMSLHICRRSLLSLIFLHFLLLLSYRLFLRLRRSLLFESETPPSCWHGSVLRGQHFGFVERDVAKTTTNRRREIPKFRQWAQEVADCQRVLPQVINRVSCWFCRIEDVCNSLWHEQARHDR